MKKTQTVRDLIHLLVEVANQDKLVCIKVSQPLPTEYFNGEIVETPESVVLLGEENYDYE